MKILVFALLTLALAACAPNGGPRPSSMHHIEPGPPPAPAAAPLGLGPTVMPSRMMAPPRPRPRPAPRCHVEKKRTVKDGVRHVTKYRVCR